MNSVVSMILSIVVRFLVASVASVIAVILERVLRDDIKDIKVKNVIGIVSIAIINATTAFTGRWMISIMIGFIAGLAIVDYFTREISIGSIIILSIFIIVNNIMGEHLGIFEIVILAVVAVAVMIGKMGLTDWVAIAACMSYYKANYCTEQAMNFVILSFVIFVGYSMTNRNKDGEQKDMLGSIAVANVLTLVTAYINGFRG